MKQAEEQIAQAGAHSSKVPEQLHQKQQLRDPEEGARPGPGGEKHASLNQRRRGWSATADRFAYNAQAVVDQKAQIILASEVTSQANDSQQLVGMVAQARKQRTDYDPRLGARGWAMPMPRRHKQHSSVDTKW
ncbi:MAG: hypothetical protein U1F61_27040 [Opitutaceae bacterium]